MRVSACGEIVVVDPAAHTPEIDCFNLIARLSRLPATYHLPALFGLDSLRAGSLASRIYGIVILGSQASVYDPLAWQEELKAWLRPHMEEGVAILGLCYGHQLIAHMLGAKVGLLPGGVKQKGLRSVEILPDPRLALDNALQGPLVVSHREVVEEVPGGMELFAHSSTVAIDGLRHLKWPLWSLQAHPEATQAFCDNQAITLDDTPQNLQFGWQFVARFLDYACLAERNAGS